MKSPNKNKIGLKFGKLTPFKKSPNKDKSGAYFYECVCDCGNTVFVSTKHLHNRIEKSGRRGTSSCGCLQVEATKNIKRRQPGPPHTRILTEYKANAKARSIEWDLSENTFITLISKNCTYCDAPPSLRRGGLKFNGIDRTDNNVHYTESNCVPCCTSCNKSKLNRTVEEFSNWIISVYDNFCKGGFQRSKGDNETR